VSKEYPMVEIKKEKLGNKTKSLAYCSSSPSRSLPLTACNHQPLAATHR